MNPEVFHIDIPLGLKGCERFKFIGDEHDKYLRRNHPKAVTRGHLRKTKLHSVDLKWVSYRVYYEPIEKNEWEI